MKKKKIEQPETPEGKIVDFIDGKLRADSETEQVRQDFERTLIEEYRYDRADIGDEADGDSGGHSMISHRSTSSWFGAASQKSKQRNH